MRLNAFCCGSVTLTLGVLLVGGCSRSAIHSSDGCIEGEFLLTRAHPTAMFLLDRSESMNVPMSGDGFWGTRWDALSDALANTLPSMDSNVQVGALLFPASAASGNCYVNPSPELAPALGNVPAALALINKNLPGGATPTDAAIESAATTLLETPTSSGARALVLATDGGPDCNAALVTSTCRCTYTASGTCDTPSQCLDDKRTIEHIADYRKRGLLTYVIGIQSPGDVDFSDVLNAMAVAGGHPQTEAPQKYYAARSKEELNAALTAISRMVGECVFLTSSVPDVGGSIVLTLNGVALTADQWLWQDRDNGEIVLESAVCARLHDQSSSTLVARVTCGSK